MKTRSTKSKGMLVIAFAAIALSFIAFSSHSEARTVATANDYYVYFFGPPENAADGAKSDLRIKAENAILGDEQKQFESCMEGYDIDVTQDPGDLDKAEFQRQQAAALDCQDRAGSERRAVEEAVQPYLQEIYEIVQNNAKPVEQELASLGDDDSRRDELIGEVVDKSYAEFETPVNRGRIMKTINQVLKGKN